MIDPHLYLYGTGACHLCDQAELLLSTVLDNAQECLKKVDVSASDKLITQYGTRIPVLRAQHRDGHWEELQWPFDQPALRAFLALVDA